MSVSGGVDVESPPLASSSPPLDKNPPDDVVKVADYDSDAEGE